jgi:hypothetical protein
MNIKAIKPIVSRINDMDAAENPEVLFEISIDTTGDLIVDWRSKEAKMLITNLACELGLDYHYDFKKGHTRAEDLPERLNSREKVIEVFKQTLREYINMAEIFTK